jgi:hypothetical protein
MVVLAAVFAAVAAVAAAVKAVLKLAGIVIPASTSLLCNAITKLTAAIDLSAASFAVVAAVKLSSANSAFVQVVAAAQIVRPELTTPLMVT